MAPQQQAPAVDAPAAEDPMVTLNKCMAEAEATPLDRQEQDQFVKSRMGHLNQRRSGTNNTEVRGIRRKLL